MKTNILLFFVIIFLFLFGFVMAIDNSENNKVSEDVINSLENSSEIRVFVQVQNETTGFIFKKTKDKEIVKGEIIGQIGEENVKHDFGNSFSVEINKDDLKILEKRAGVERVSLVGTKHILLSDSVPIINANVAQSIQINGINLTGKGQTVCIIDTGVNYSHISLGGCYGNNNVSSSCKVMGGIDYCADDNTCTTSDGDPMDVEGHGTHVSGIVAANGTIRGIAPEAKIIMIKASDSTGTFSDDDIIAGINWCVANSSIFNISVISMSLGGGLYDDYCDTEPLENVFASPINNAVAKNISVVVATGNDGYYDVISSPACITNATPISSSVKADNAISSFANTWNNYSKTILVAPGSSIVSTSISGSSEVKSGTSMATPHVAGTIAIINQYLTMTGRTKTPRQIRDLLNNTGKLIFDEGNSNLNFSRINVYTALLSLDISAPNVSLNSPVNNVKTINRSINFTCLSSDFLLKNITFYLWNSSSLYYNETKNITGISNSTIFNLTNINFNDYNWSCRAFDNVSNSFMANNFSFSLRRILNNLVFPLNNTYTKLNETNFTCLSEANNAFNLTNVTFYLWNSSSNLVYNETKNITGISNSTNFNYTLSSEDIYSWNCLSFNNNSDSAIFDYNYSLTYDITFPNIILISPSDSSSYTSNSQEIIFEYNVSENYLINNCSLIILGAVSLTNFSIINFSALHSFTQTFSPASYSWSINCTDKAGNIANSSSRSFSVSAPVSPPSSSSGGGGGGGSSVKTLSLSELSSGSNQQLSSGGEVKFNLPVESSSSEVISSASSSSSHSLKINKVENNRVNITIRSNPINLILYVGEERKLNLSSSEYYDLYVKLNNITYFQANLTIKVINEKINITSQISNEDKEDKEETQIEQENSDYAKVYRYVLSIIFILIIIMVSFLLFRKLKTNNAKKYLISRKKKK